MRAIPILPAAFAALALFGGAAAAAPPRPLPNPDRPAVTPVLGPEAGVSANPICPTMRRIARSGNSGTGLSVKNLGSGKIVCSLNARANRSMASNTKIFTTVTALGRLGPSHRSVTKVYADGDINRNGVLKGDLYLRGDGDPSLGTKGFLSAYSAGTGASVAKLATLVKRAGIKRVTGRLYGDDGVFDRLRGVADSGYRTSPWIGPLSGLSVNAGFTSSSLSRFSSNPARLATKTLVREFRKRKINIRPEIALGKTPGGDDRSLVARLPSPPMTWMSRLTNLNSNNFFAEMLLKQIGAEVRGSGTTAAGAKVVRRYAASFDSKVKPVDGSGLTVGNRSNPAAIVTLLNRIRNRPFFDAFFDSLPVAGRDGTLASRMRGSLAEGRCHAKTGTLTGVSALSGYCYNDSGRKFAFSILMNGVRDSFAARAAQDRIAAMIARL